MAGNELATRPAEPTALKKADVSNLIEANKGELAKVLPKHLTIDRLAKVLIFALDANPDLYKCSQVSLFRAVKQLAELGLEPGGVRGLAYLIPYKVKGADLGRECQLIIGYKGLCQLARRSGMVLDIEARVVHDNDPFELEFGLEPRLMHRPSMNKPGAPVGVYSIATLTGTSGGKPVHHVEFMRWDEVMAIKARSKASGSGPWVTDEEQMARKTGVRRLMNYLDLSPEVSDALNAEDSGEGYNQGSRLVDVGGQTVTAPIPRAVPVAPVAPALPATSTPLAQAELDRMAEEYDQQTGEVVESAPVQQQESTPPLRSAPVDAPRPPAAAAGATGGEQQAQQAKVPMEQPPAFVPPVAPTTPPKGTDAFADWLIERIQTGAPEQTKKLASMINDTPESRRPEVTKAYLSRRKS